MSWGPSEDQPFTAVGPASDGPQYGWTQAYAPAPAPAFDPGRAAAPYPPASTWTPSATAYGGSHLYVPPLDGPTQEELAWATAAHWLPLFTHWVGPLAVLLTVGRRSERVRAAAVTSLNWEITVAVLLAASAGLARFGVVGPVLAIAVILFSIGMHVLAAGVVAKGATFDYPLALPIIR